MASLQAELSSTRGVGAAASSRTAMLEAELKSVREQHMGVQNELLATRSSEAQVSSSVR